MTASLPSETLLVEALQRHDAAAFSMLYDNYSAAIFGIITRIVADNEAAEELLQDSFMKIWKNANQYDAAKGRLFTWMLNVARNVAIDHVRLKKNQQKSNELDDSVLGAMEQRSLSAPLIDTLDIHQLTEKLAPEHRALVELIYLQGYTQAETAEALNMPLGTVKTRLRAALLQLRSFFALFLLTLTLYFLQK